MMNTKCFLAPSLTLGAVACDHKILVQEAKKMGGSYVA